MGKPCGVKFEVCLWALQLLGYLCICFSEGVQSAHTVIPGIALAATAVGWGHLPPQCFVTYLQCSFVYYASLWKEQAGVFALASSLLFSLYELKHSVSHPAAMLRNLVLWTGWGLYYACTAADPAPTVTLLLSAEVLSVSAWRLKASRKASRRSSWAAVLSACPDGVVVVGSRSVQCNLKALELLEVASDTEALHKLTELSCPQGPVLTIFAGETAGKQCFTDSESRRIEWRGSKIEDKAVIFLRDFTAWRACERATAEECARKEALLRSISHELRTPINAVINLGEELRQALRGKELLTLKIIASSSRFLLSTVNDLLDCALISAGKFVLKKGPFRGEEVFKDCIQMIEAQCKLKGITLVLRYDRCLPAVIYSDQARLRQVLLNLLSNAVKFTLKGHIEVVALYTSRHTMLVSVKDTGIGIPLETQAKLVSMFQVVGRQVQTCCLGLSISNAIVQQLSGRSLTITSSPDRGSIFSFDLHISENVGVDVLVSGVEDESCMRDESRSEVLIPLFTPPQEEAQVLVVDDSEFNRVVLLRILESNGYRCHQAFTGLQALIAVRRKVESGSVYRVILMDVDMPEMDGVTATRELREMVLRGELPSMPIVVACSAFSSADHEDMCLEAGMSHYLEKPISRDTLLRLLSRLLPLECSLED